MTYWQHTANTKTQNFDPHLFRPKNLGAQLRLSAENEPFEVCNLIGSLAPSTRFSVSVRMFSLLFGGVLVGARSSLTAQMKELANLIRFPVRKI